MSRSAVACLGPTGEPPGSYLKASVGPVAPDGRIFMAVDWFFPAADLPDVEGLYLVDRDLTRSERLSHGVPVHPIGFGPNLAWVAGLRGEPEGSGYALTRVDLPSGAERTLLPPGELVLAYAGQTAPTGTIALATRGHKNPGFASYATFGDAWLVNPSDGTRRNLTNGAFSEFTAFAWAPSDVLGQLSNGGNTRPHPSIQS
jgi:hypothetical protein